MTPRPGVDPEALARGDAHLERALRELDRRLQGHVESWAGDLDDEVTVPLRSCLDAMADAHRRLAEEAGLPSPPTAPQGGPEESEDETPPAEAAAPERGEDSGPSPCPDWQCLRRYRDGVSAEVVAPLLAFLTERRPAERISSGWHDFVLGLRGCADPLPEELVRTEPGDLYGTEEGDGPLRALRKLVGRAGRSLGGLFGGGGPRPQPVPLRSLARTQLRGEGLPGMVELGNDLHRHHAGPLTELEMALGRWLRAWFPLEDPRHAPFEHLTSAQRGELERLRALASDHASRAKVEDADAEVEARGEDGTGDRSPPAPVPESAPGSEEEGPPGPEDSETVEPETPEPVPERDDPEETTDPADVVRALQASLERARDLAVAPEDVLDRVRQGIHRLRDDLDRRIRYAGTGMDRPPGASEDRRLARLRERMVVSAGRWRRWYELAGNRARLTCEVLEFRRDMDEILETLLGGGLDASVLYLEEWLGEARDGLLELRDRADDPGAPLIRSRNRQEAAAAIEATLEQARELLERSIRDPLEPERLTEPVRQVLDISVEGIERRLRTLAESVDVHPIRTPTPPPDPEQATRTIPIRESVRQPLDALHLEELRTSVTPLLTFLAEARSQCREIPNVVSYNLEAAREELLAEEPEPGEGKGESEKRDPEALLEDARNLTLQGLERTAVSLDGVLAGSVEPFDGFARDAHGIVHRALVQAHERITMERAVQEQIRDVRTLVLARARVVRERLSRRWDQFLSWARREGRKRYIQLRRLIRKGRHAVGAEAGADGDVDRAMEVLSSIPALLETLPLVYRRLFSFQPVSDPALLVGRDRETAWVIRRWAAWREGHRSPSMLTGPISVGHTSFLNVLSATVFKDATVVRLGFGDRPPSVEGVAARVAEVLREAEVLGGEEGPWTLERLASRLLDHRDAKEAVSPPVILVEHLAHLFLRTHGGGDILERFLDFQARTSPAVFWLSTGSDPFWKLVRKTEPRASALVTTSTMSGMDRAGVESMIMVRHQRSGVPLEFLEPSNPNPLLRRKLQRSRSEEERQALLREEFFDRLHRGSRGNMIMAILLWLRSADFESREGWLRLRPPRPLRFAFLEELDLEVDFALMALLEHTSLTLGEFARVFAVDEDAAYQTLEVLRSRMLIDRLSTMGGLPEPVVTVRDGVRYRIPPILAQVVSEYLRNHNILH